MCWYHKGLSQENHSPINSTFKGNCCRGVDLRDVVCAWGVLCIPKATGP